MRSASSFRDNEFVEVTPQLIQLRKKVLKTNQGEALERVPEGPAISQPLASRRGFLPHFSYHNRMLLLSSQAKMEKAKFKRFVELLRGYRSV